MNKKTLVISISLVFFIFFFFFVFSQKNIIPQTSVDVLEKDSILNFGMIDITQNKEYEVSFHVKNRTWAPLIIEKIIPSCECIKVKCNSKYALKNDMVEISVIYKPEKIKSGEFYREVEVYGNFASPIYLSVRGEIQDKQ